MSFFKFSLWPHRQTASAFLQENPSVFYCGHTDKTHEKLGTTFLCVHTVESSCVSLCVHSRNCLGVHRQCGRVSLWEDVMGLSVDDE